MWEKELWKSNGTVDDLDTGSENVGGSLIESKGGYVWEIRRKVDKGNGGESQREVGEK